jgi:hypothetical protein
MYNMKNVTECSLLGGNLMAKCYFDQFRALLLTLQQPTCAKSEALSSLAFNK